MIETYFTNPDESMNWPEIWMAFAGYSLVVAVLFAVLFRHKHDPAQVNAMTH
jgi:NHS family xanthosine MFS transporter